jgi:hypothetical protein
VNRVAVAVQLGRGKSAAHAAPDRAPRQMPPQTIPTRPPSGKQPAAPRSGRSVSRDRSDGAPYLVRDPHRSHLAGLSLSDRDGCALPIRQARPGYIVYPIPG